MDNQTPISPEEVRDWLKLPPNILSDIFLKLGAIHILLRAQLVCSTWRKASKEPSLFRSIHVSNNLDLFVMIGGVSYEDTEYYMQKMVLEAVDRSCGQLVDFSLEHFCCHDLLAYIAEKSGSLRRLRLVCCYEVSDDALINLAKKAVMLEELDICHCKDYSFSKNTLKTVGNACPQLKSFRLNSQGYIGPGEKRDDVALAIAETMPQLCHLQIFGNGITDVGLRAILDGCLCLESLDLRWCFKVNLEGDLLKSCRDRLVKLRLPNDSTDDYEFEDAIDNNYDYYTYEDFDLG